VTRLELSDKEDKAMNNATRVTVSTFGLVAGLAGIEHGIGEILQGNVAPGGLVIRSWPDSPWFRIVDGEPAMTLVPNLLASGILAILASLLFLMWVTLFVQRKNGGLVLMLLSILMLLVGAGFGPPLLGLILGVAATRIQAPRPWWGRRQVGGAGRFLAALWPWSLAAALIAWLSLMPGSMLFEHYFGMANPDLVVATLTLAAFGLLLVTIVAGFAHDGRPASFSLSVPHGTSFE
jgi:hypothetical protein